jgi:NADH-quinone oxidoreductase subunit G
MAKITVDGKVFEVNPDNNLLEEILSNEQDLPYFCWHPAMGSVGSCRQCAIIEYANDEDQRGRQVMACMTSPREGGRYSIEKAATFRAQAIESIMTKHPHDCPVCEEGGECHLQDMTVMSGHTYRRYDGKKLTHNNQYLGPFIGHEMNRCITCYRCVRFYKDYAGGTDFGPQASHNHTYFGRFQEGPLESEFSGNLAEVCPTGVFTDKVFSQHYSRKWDLQTAPSICSACSVGCNTNPGERYGTLRRVVNRFNDEVNGYFLCDKGRFGTGYVNSDERIRMCMTRKAHDGRPVQIQEDQARGLLAALQGKAIGIGSPRASLEANFALREFVGADNFHAGIPASELKLLQQVHEIYTTRAVTIASVKDIEQADAVLVIGEDVTNTAARLALALRQSVKNLGKEMAAQLKFPAWHDAAIRTLTMDKKSPLYILSAHATRLDDIAKVVHIATAADSARIGFAVAHAINGAAPAINDLTAEEQALVGSIANDLKSAKRPLVVSGTSVGSAAVLSAAANVASALAGDNRRAGIALVVPEANSLGLALMMQGADKALEQAMSSGNKQVIVLENDLYRRAADAEVSTFLGGLEQLVVIDSLQNRTGEAANLVLPAATSFESAGTFINYEGRAQHYYSVFKPAAPVQASSYWLAADMKIHDLTAAVAKLLPNGEALGRLTPGENFTFAGMKVPRQHHRYSGRTAMRAHLNVHEPKQELDGEGIMAYSMEGVPPLKDFTVFNSPWAPGWNSNQALFKFQDHTGGPLRSATHGERLLHSGDQVTWYPADSEKPAGEGYEVFPLYHLFGSEELTAHSDAIQEKATGAYIALNPEDAARLGLNNTDGVQVQHNGALPFIQRASVRSGTVGVSVGLAGLNIHNLGARIALDKATDWRAPKDWRAGNIIASDARRG